MAAGCCVGSSCRFPAAPGLEESNRLEGEEPNAAGGQGLGWHGLQGPPPRAENPLKCRGMAQALARVSPGPHLGTAQGWNPAWLSLSLTAQLSQGPPCISPWQEGGPVQPAAARLVKCPHEMFTHAVASARARHSFMGLLPSIPGWPQGLMVNQRTNLTRFQTQLGFFPPKRVFPSKQCWPLSVLL